MFVDVRSLGHGAPCAIRGFGHTELPDEYRYDNPRFIREILTVAGRRRMFGELGLSETPEAEAVERSSQKFVEATGIASRFIFPGSTADLGALAADVCLADAGVDAQRLDAIVVGTNTGCGYPSTADRIKEQLGVASPAMCFDVQEACPVSAVAIFVGWNLIRSGVCQRVLVVGAEKGSQLASPDDYKGANLFGDAASAMLLTVAEADDFSFFAFESDPFDGRSKYIVRLPSGCFRQDGPAVHKYVATTVPRHLAETLRQADLNPATVDHLIPHQPSTKTLNFLVSMLYRQWPGWRDRVTIHRNIETMGNTSGACVGWLVSRAVSSGQLRVGQRCLVTTFGSGMSLGTFAFTLSKRSGD